MTALTLENELSGLLSSIEPKARRQLAREIAKTLRPSQQQRIAEQRNPDGSAFQARKTQLRGKKGAIRRQMFSKLRTARFMRMETSPDAAVISFVAQVQRLAQVHQWGLRDRVRPGGPEVLYPARQLLGLTDLDVEAVASATIKHLAR